MAQPQPSARAKPGPTVRDNPYLALPPDLRGLAQRVDRINGIRGVSEIARTLDQTRAILTVPENYVPPTPASQVSGISTPTWFRQSPTPSPRPSVSPARPSPIPLSPVPSPPPAAPSIPPVSPPRDIRIPPPKASQAIRPFLARVEALRQQMPRRVPTPAVIRARSPSPAPRRQGPFSPSYFRERSPSLSPGTVYAEGARPFVRSLTSSVPSVRVRLRSPSRPANPSMGTEAGRREFARLVGAPRVEAARAALYTPERLRAAQAAMAGRPAPRRAARSASFT
jgi:hypothetical protein